MQKAGKLEIEKIKEAYANKTEKFATKRKEFTEAKKAEFMAFKTSA